MLFRNIPESQSLTNKSKFVYSEDEEHLKYISRDNLYRNIPKMFVNKYGKDEPIKINSDMYDKMDYIYENAHFDTSLIYNTTEDKAWVPDNYLNYHRYPPYTLKDNRVSFKIVWNKPLSYYNSVNDVKLLEEWHYDYVNVIPEPRDWTPYCWNYKRLANASTIASYDVDFSFDPGPYGNYYFPARGKSYIMKFKVRLHNLVNEETLMYYTQLDYIAYASKFDYLHRHIVQEPKLRPLTFVNGVSINFRKVAPKGASLAVVNDPVHSYAYSERHQQDMGPEPFAEYHPNPDPTKKPERTWGEWNNLATVYNHNPGFMTGTDPLIGSTMGVWEFDEEGYRNESNYDKPRNDIRRRWAENFKNIPRDTVVNFKTAANIDPSDLEIFNESSEQKWYHNYWDSWFVRFAADNEWHEYSVEFNIDDVYDPGDLDHLEPELNFWLSGLRPTTENDSYVEVKDLEIKSKPWSIGEAIKYIDIDHIYLNKDGIWLPEDFAKERDQADISLHRDEGTKIAEAEFGGTSIDVFSPPVVSSASVDANYDHGTKIFDFKINGVSNPVYHPTRAITGANVLLPVTWQQEPYAFDIFDFNTGSATILNKQKKRPAIKPDENNIFSVEFDNFDQEYSFGHVNLNNSYITSFSNNDDRSGYWDCRASIDICTSDIYTPDTIGEYLRFYVVGGYGSFFNNTNLTLEKRIPMSIFSGETLNYYKITIPFIYYIPSSSDTFIIDVGMQGKLKPGVVLTTSENLKVTLTARRIVEY